MHGRTGSEADNQLPFHFDLEAHTARRHARLLWILAATPADSRRIADYLRRTTGAVSPDLLICLDDGSTPIGLNDIVAFRIDAELRLFTGAERGTDSGHRALAESVERSFRKAGLARSRTRLAQECLFIRLAGGRRTRGSADACGHELGRSLALIHNADPRRDARFIHEVAGDLLDRLPDVASPALEAMLRRLKAGAIYQLCKSVTGFERSRLQEAASLYRAASSRFASVGLVRQADRCTRDFRTIAELSATHSGHGQLPLPGFEEQRGAAPQLRGLGFHAFRILAVPLTLGASATSTEQSILPPAVLRAAGSIKVPERSLLRALDAFESTSLIPQLAVMRIGGLSRRLRLSVDREHLALLGLPDHSRADRPESFSFFAAAPGWQVSPDHGFVRPGEPVELVAKAASSKVPPLQLVVHGGLNNSRFEVSAAG